MYIFDLVLYLFIFKKRVHPDLFFFYKVFIICGQSTPKNKALKENMERSILVPCPVWIVNYMIELKLQILRMILQFSIL